MKSQSLSVVVPNKMCVNNCAFCVAQMETENYPNMLNSNKPFYDLYQTDYIKRLEFARDIGCNIVMLTGNSEPQQNRRFLEIFGTMNKQLKSPFRWIEMQTTGVMIEDEYLRFLRNHVGISTISVSISSFDDEINMKYNGTRKNLKVNIKEFCKSVKKYDFNLRISINLTDDFNKYTPKEIFEYVKELGADQVTFRIFYTSKTNTPQDKWVGEHKASDYLVSEISIYVINNGKALEILDFGATKYSVNGISTVVDNNCMGSEEVTDVMKFMILRENCKLYSKWEDKGSLIF